MSFYGIWNFKLITISKKISKIKKFLFYIIRIFNVNCIKKYLRIFHIIKYHKNNYYHFEKKNFFDSENFLD